MKQKNIHQRLKDESWISEKFIKGEMQIAIKDKSWISEKFLKLINPSRELQLHNGAP